MQGETVRTAESSQVIGNWVDWTVRFRPEGVEGVVAASGSIADHLGGGVDSKSLARRTPERAQIISEGIDGTVGSRAKSMQGCVAASGSIADHLVRRC